jgi:hypothetical protein
MNKAMVALVLALTSGLVSADDSSDVRSMLEGLNRALRQSGTPELKDLVVTNASYRDGGRKLEGANAIALVFNNHQPWSERTRPVLDDLEIRIIGGSVAIVDANLVQYGSMILKSAVPAVIVLEKHNGSWKISSWTSLNCGTPN